MPLHLHFVAQVSYEAGEPLPILFRFRINDSDGKDIIPGVAGEAGVSPTLASDRSAVRVLLGMNLMLTKYTSYRFVLTLDDEVAVSLPFTVLQQFPEPSETPIVTTPRSRGSPNPRRPRS